MKLIAVFTLLCGVSALAQPTATLVPSTTSYAAGGGTVSFNVTITYTGTVSAIGLTLGRVPAGWSFGGLSGRNIPQIATSPGATGKFEFAYTSVPPSPVTFTFTAEYPAGLSGSQVFSEGVAIVRPDHPDLALPNITFTPGAGPPPPTPPAIVTAPQSVAVPEGLSAVFSVVATGTEPLTYQWRKDGAALAGATTSSLTVSAVTAAAAGAYSVVVSNPGGAVTSTLAQLTVTVISRPAPPMISAQPASQSVVAGANVTFTVTAGGAAPLTYQWRKDGVSLPGQTAATLALSNVGTAASGAYSVVVGNTAGTVTSIPATLTVTTREDTRTAPRIAAPPRDQEVAAGASVAFTVAATGSGPLQYQWRKDGAPLTGATQEELRIPAVVASDAGSYSVAVSNSVGSVISAAARLSVTVPAVPTRVTGAYLGTIDGGGSFALLAHSGGRADFLASARGVLLVQRDIDMAIMTGGAFRFTATAVATGSRSPAAPATAAAEPEYVVEAAVSSTGGLSGRISGLNASMTAAPAAATGTTASVMGFYQSGVVGKSSVGYTIVSADGEAFLATVGEGVVDVGRGRVEADGSIDVTTERNARVTGAVSAAFATISLNVRAETGGVVTFFGGNAAARTTVEKLVNISTRSQTSASGALITGFVINGEQAKPVLVRAIGPSLEGFGVSGALSAARLEVFRGDARVASGDDWGRALDAAAIAAAAERVGAFPLSAGSRDAALLLTLTPGAYTAIVTGQGGSAGVSLVEAYDATANPGGAQRIINVSTRALAGAGDATLIAGFVIRGVVPKRVLVRGVGPALGMFGVTGTLARPRVAIYSGETLLAENTGWSTSVDAALVAQASAAVGAFALAADSADAALIINLSPGTYTAQVSGLAGTTGDALIELYEVP